MKLRSVVVALSAVVIGAAPLFAEAARGGPGGGGRHFSGGHGGGHYGGHRGYARGYSGVGIGIGLGLLGAAIAAPYVARPYYGYPAYAPAYPAYPAYAPAPAYPAYAPAYPAYAPAYPAYAPYGNYDPYYNNGYYNDPAAPGY